MGDWCWGCEQSRIHGKEKCPVCGKPIKKEETK